jgi:hypothetical protein
MPALIYFCTFIAAFRSHCQAGIVEHARIIVVFHYVKGLLPERLALHQILRVQKVVHTQIGKLTRRRLVTIGMIAVVMTKDEDGGMATNVYRFKLLASNELNQVQHCK